MEGAVTNIIPSSLLNARPTSAGPRASGTSYNQQQSGDNRRFQGVDRITLSPASRDQKTGNSLSNNVSSTAPAAAGELSQEELAQLQQLKSRDLEVRTHEQAHIAAAGQYAASGASFTYQRGPDGNRYAVGGEVQIDISKESSPEETIQKMEVIARAALAPANPSPADRQIAAQAAIKASQARQELLKESQEEGEAIQNTDENTDGSATPEVGRQATPQPLDPDAAGSATLKTMIESYQAMQELGRKS